MVQDEKPGTKTSLNPRIVSLDYLRGLAALLVFLGHFEIINLRGIAVDLFFTLSSFTLSYSLLNKLDKRISISYLNFIKRRLFRILPSYYFFLFLSWFIAYLFIKPISPNAVYKPFELPQYLFFFRNYGGPPARMSFEHLWSLSVEVQFYLLLPLLFILLQKYYESNIKTLTKWVVFLIIAGFSIKLQAYFTDFADWPTYSHNRIDSFAWGILTSIFIYRQQYNISKIINNAYIGTGGIIILILAIYLKPVTDEHDLLLRCIAPFCWNLIIIGFFNLKTPALSALQVISKYSYNIYLWHFFLLIPIIFHLGYTVIGFIIYSVFTAIFAYFTTTLIENRIIKLIKRPAAFQNK